ncbi:MULTISPECIES: shikimate kinase [Syntrophothermus]|uniref:Shikimate kinase n=1 Tax=Syntrophothermus lipocalidus (strain DSM 12680 / TGB-C1) TaxID=643648 RepID=D7CKE8_SYNLT|nr:MULTISPECIES: shikimate kinase [Syntrophothermus]ADI01183.1 Shikimate kinase [Syntrophothermus lipocalidus DSM 12680]NSW81853.1 shikimate kinase [Syntrophothermus sp.]
MGKNIVLIGFMGTGKSTIGQRLARKLGMIFVDTDREIEKITGMTVAEIFRKHGEKRFRSEEKLLAHKLAQREGLIISCGGGMPLDPENMKVLGENGVIIGLKASPEDVFRRVMRKRHHRPLIDRELTLERLRAMMAEREKYYQCAHITVDTSTHGIEELVHKIILNLKEFCYGKG